MSTFNSLKQFLHFLLTPITVYVHFENTSLQVGKKKKREPNVRKKKKQISKQQKQEQRKRPISNFGLCTERMHKQIKEPKRKNVGVKIERTTWILRSLKSSSLVISSKPFGEKLLSFPFVFVCVPLSQL